LELKSLQKKIETFFKDIKKTARAAWKAVCDKESEELGKLTPCEAHLKGQILAYQQKLQREKQEAEAQTRRLQEAQEAKQVRAALAARAEGNISKAIGILQTPIHVTTEPVAQVTRVAGITPKVIWRFKVTDINLVPREYLVLNEAAVRAVVVVLKEKTNIPGIEAYSDDILAVGGR